MRELFELLKADIYTDAWEYRERVERIQYLVAKYDKPLHELLEEEDEPLLDQEEPEDHDEH